MTVFSCIVLIGIVVARALTDRFTQAALEAVVGSTVKSKYPHFKPGVTLRGILADWSDTQRSAIGFGLGENLATELCKGCKVNIATLVDTRTYQLTEWVLYHIMAIFHCCRSTTCALSEEDGKVSSAVYSATEGL